MHRCRWRVLQAAAHLLTLTLALTPTLTLSLALTLTLSKYRPQLISFRLLTTDNSLPTTQYYSVLTPHYSPPPYRPELIFLVVQKRTHCRLFTPENGGQTLGNALPGTVIDSQITANGQVPHARLHAPIRTTASLLPC